MALSKAITIGLAAFLTAPAVTAVGGSDTCHQHIQEEPHFGPKGLYSSSTTGQCIYVDATANGDFATTFPADYEGFIANTHMFSSKIPEATADLSAVSG